MAENQAPNSDNKKVTDDFFGRVSKQFNEFWKTLSFQKRIAMMSTATVIAAAIAALFMWAGNRTYSTLMTNLNPEDSTQVIRLLKEKNIPFRVDNGGRNISVASENMDTLRMELAMGGLPQTSVIGYEVFDKQSLGTPSFVQKVNQKRALEGEIMRTVNSIHGVKRSRVHLALPQKSAFVEDQKKATASVVLDLEPGITLQDKQIYGIGTLVARAVEGLDVSDVVIVDSLGKTLSKNQSDALSQMTASQLDFKAKLEKEYQTRIEDILSKVVGEGHVVAKVSTDLDFSSITETQTSYDQDGAAIKSKQTNSQSQEGSKPVAAGAAGAQANTPIQGAGGPSSVKISDVKNANEVTNYAVPETTRRVTRSPGSVKKMSVAVVVDGKITRVKNAEGNFESKAEAWSPEKLKEFEAIISSAVGIDLKRGDTLDVKNMEFKQVDFTEAEAILAEREKKLYMQSLFIYLAIAVTIILFFFTVVRPFIKWITDNTTDGVDTFLPQTLEELEKAAGGALPGMEDAMPTMPDQVDPEKIESEMVKEKVVALIDANPQKAALILRDWILGNDLGRKPKEDGSPAEESEVDAG